MLTADELFIKLSPFPQLYDIIVLDNLEMFRNDHSFPPPSPIINMVWFLILGRVGGRAVGYYLGTTLLAVVLGIILVVTIHPGQAGQDKVRISQK